MSRSKMIVLRVIAQIIETLFLLVAVNCAASSLLTISNSKHIMEDGEHISQFSRGLFYFSGDGSTAAIVGLSKPRPVEVFANIDTWLNK